MGAFTERARERTQKRMKERAERRNTDTTMSLSSDVSDPSFANDNIEVDELLRKFTQEVQDTLNKSMGDFEDADAFADLILATLDEAKPEDKDCLSKSISEFLDFALCEVVDGEDDFHSSTISELTCAEFATARSGKRDNQVMAVRAPSTPLVRSGNHTPERLAKDSLDSSLHSQKSISKRYEEVVQANLRRLVI